MIVSGRCLGSLFEEQLDAVLGSHHQLWLHLYLVGGVHRQLKSVAMATHTEAHVPVHAFTFALKQGYVVNKSFTLTKCKFAYKI